LGNAGSDGRPLGEMPGDVAKITHAHGNEVVAGCSELIRV
jgi:hypothetical protein